MTESEEDEWCGARRQDVEKYLKNEDLRHGVIGDWPAWFIPPYVSVWAIESLKVPGSVGWWVICGDLPTDYCSAQDCRNPRLAVRKIAESWHAAASNIKPGTRKIGSTNLSVSLAPVIIKRAEALMEWVNDATIWPE